LQDFYAEMAQAKAGLASDAARIAVGPSFEGDKTIYKVIPPEG